MVCETGKEGVGSLSLGSLRDIEDNPEGGAALEPEDDPSGVFDDGWGRIGSRLLIMRESECSRFTGGVVFCF